MILQSQPAGADAWLVVAAPTACSRCRRSESAAVRRSGRATGGPDGFRTALELLIGNGIAGAPPFALLDGDASVLRVVLRGDAASPRPVADPRCRRAHDQRSGHGDLVRAGARGRASLRLQVPGSTWTRDRSSPAGAPAPAAPTAPARAAAPTAASRWSPRRAGGGDRRAATVAPSAPVAEVTLVPGTDRGPGGRGASGTRGRAARREPEPPRVEPRADPDSGALRLPVRRHDLPHAVGGVDPDPQPGSRASRATMTGSTMLADDLGLRGHVPEVPVSPEVPAGSRS